MEGMKPGHCKDDGEPAERWGPFSNDLSANVSSQDPKYDAEDQHQQVDVVVIHFHMDFR